MEFPPEICQDSSMHTKLTIPCHHSSHVCHFIPFSTSI